MPEGGYRQLDPAVAAEVKERLDRAYLSPYACRNEDAVRRIPEGGSVLRPAFLRDAERVLNDKHYNRYADKTQVFSFYKNDDITRRALHVQLVSRIARNIGRALGLNLDLIEAIALGHDIGHTPFGHAGERMLCALYHRGTGRWFYHNVHSVRVLDEIYQWNLTLQTLDGILCHNGELPRGEYRPQRYADFAEFSRRYEACYTDREAADRLVPATLEGCVVRMSDIIAYLGKDRQDAVKAQVPAVKDRFAPNPLGRTNSEIIHNAICDIVEQSLDRDAVCMSSGLFDALCALKDANTREIYRSGDISRQYDEILQPMFERVYGELLDEVRSGRQGVLYRHYLQPIRENPFLRDPYEAVSPDQIVTDYIASMTDDYFIDLYCFLFGEESPIAYVSYFAQEEGE